MKKLTLLALSLIVLGGVVGCGSSDGGGEPAPKIDAEKDAQTQKDGGAQPTQAQD